MSKNHLIIYPNFGQRISSWDINSACGKYDIPLLKSTDNNSLIIYTDADGVIGKLDYTHVHPKPMFTVGSKVAVSNEIGTYGKYVLGHISRINQGSVEIVAKVDEKLRTYRINDYRQISSYGQSNQNDYLVVNIKSEDEGHLKLSYLFGNIGWNAHYTVILDETHIKQFVLSATIKNNTDENLTGRISLVAGSIRRPYQYESQPRAMAMMETTQAEPEPTVSHSEFDEHYKYELGEYCLDNEKRIDLVTCVDTESQKYYMHDISSYNRVVYGYKFKAPTFLPQGDIYIYTKEEDDVLYTGTSHMQEYREDDKVDLTVGKTTQVQIESNISQTDRKIVNPDDTETHQSDISIESVIDNKSDSPVLVILKYHVGNNEVVTVDPSPTRKKNGYLEWDMMANPNKGKVEIKLVLSS